MPESKSLQSLIKKDTKSLSQYKQLNWTGTFDEYLDIVYNKPRIPRNAYQRLYDMVMSHGTTEFEYCKRKYTKYNFFEQGENISIYGLEEQLMEFVDVLKSAARHYGPERRIILLHGPVGSAKSTIVTLLKKGLENYSKTDEGALYSFSWNIKDDQTGEIETINCPMNEEPLKLLPKEVREKVVSDLNKKLGKDEYKIKLNGNLSPLSEYYQNKLLDQYGGDYIKMLQHVQVRRVTLSEKNRVGIGTFQPKDEKSQDATELTGDINYRKLAQYGSESDPRAFDFNGEFLISNRGMIEFQEVLKLQTEFLYDLLGATQVEEQQVYGSIERSHYQDRYTLFAPCFRRTESI